MPCGTWMSFFRRCRLLPSMLAAVRAHRHARHALDAAGDTSSCWPLITPIAAKLNACAPEPQKRFSVTPVAESGQPAASTLLRAMFAPCSSTWLTQPTTTSSTSAVEKPARWARRFSTWARQLLGVHAREGALAGLAAAARGPDRIEDEDVTHE